MRKDEVQGLNEPTEEHDVAASGERLLLVSDSAGRGSTAGYQVENSAVAAIGRNRPKTACHT